MTSNDDLPVPLSQGEGWLIGAYFYGDESGKSSDEYASFGGYIGRVQAWSEFTPQWIKLLRYYGLPAIHVGRMKNHDKEPWKSMAERHGDQWPTFLEQVFESFSGIVNGSSIQAIARHVDAQRFAQMPKVSKTYGRKPHYLAFQQCIEDCLEQIRWSSNDATIGLVVDHDKETDEGCLSLSKMLRDKRPDLGKRIASICFVDDSEFPGVQAADMLLNFTRLAIVNEVIEPNSTIKRLITPHAQPMVCGRKCLERLENILPDECNG